MLTNEYKELHRRDNGTLTVVNQWEKEWQSNRGRSCTGRKSRERQSRAEGSEQERGSIRSVEWSGERECYKRKWRGREKKEGHDL